MIEKPPQVRIATPADEERIYDIVIDLRKNGGPVARLLPYRPERVMAQIQLATRHGQGVIGVIDGPERVEASVGLFTHVPWWTDVPIFVQFWLYARPETVGLGAALLQFVAWAQDSMATDMAKRAVEFNEPCQPFLIENTHMGGGRQQAALDRLFAKYGRKVGSVFIVGMP